MRARPYPVFVAFCAFLGGVLLAGVLWPAHAFLLVTLVGGLSAFICRLRGYGPPLGFLQVMAFSLAGVLRLWLAPDGPEVAERPWAEALARKDVAVLVKVDRVIRRDRVGTVGIGRALWVRTDRTWYELGTAPSLRVSHPAFLEMVAGETCIIKGRLLPAPAPSDAISPSWPRESTPVLSFSRATDRVVIAGDGAPSRLDTLRMRLSRRLLDAMTGPASDFALALIVGDSGGISPRVRRDFSALGTAHVLAVSGLHVSAVSAIAGLIVARLAGLVLVRLSQAVNLVLAQLLASVIGAFAMAALAGAGPSACRAAAMFGVAVASRLLARPQRVEATVSVVGLVSLMAAPKDAFSLSFLLSYAAVLGIATMAGPIARGLVPRSRGFWGKVLQGVAVTIAASLPTTPITLLAFGVASPWAPLANLVVVPLVTFVLMPAALCLLACAAITPTILEPVGHVVGWLFNAFIQAQGAVAGRLGGGQGPESLMAAGIIVVCLALWVLIASGSLRAALVAGLVALPVFVAGSTEPPPDALQLHFQHVGKGDAILVRCPSGQVWLVDTGESRTFSSPFGLESHLAAKGIRRLDGVVLTHGDEDHTGGMRHLLEQGMVARMEWPCAASHDDPLPELKEMAEKMGVETRCLGAGNDALVGCGVEAKVLWPPQLPFRQGNAASLVMRLGFKGRSVLLTGDLEQEGEEGLLGQAMLRADVLQLAHHGASSSSSSAFMQAVQPAHCIASGTGGARRGEPAMDVVQRVAEVKARLWATSMCGDVTVTITKDQINVATRRRCESGRR